MKRALARKWAAALESDDYQQTIGTLRDTTGFCCLGVLCNIHAQEHPEIAAEQKDPYAYLEQDNYLPTEVMVWSGVKTSDGQFSSGHITVSDSVGWIHDAATLADLNDDIELDFKAIAKVIRKHWKDL